MTTGGPVACVGIAVMDLVFDVETLPHEPIKHFASDYREVGGGPAATGAVTVARIGGEAHLWARVGDDGWGQRILNDLQADGVRTEAVRQITNGKSSISAVMVDRRGERMIVNFGGQGLDHDPSWLPIDGISQFGAVLGDLRWLQGTQRALKAARQAGVPGVLDADLTTHDGLTEAAGASSHIIFSEPALADCTGETDVNAGLRSAHRRFGGWLAVTMGAQGAYWTADGSTVHRQPAYEVDVIDTLGAGDVFHGAFAAELARGQNETEALRWAAAAAAMKCAQPGGRAGIPTRKALERFLREQA